MDSLDPRRQSPSAQVALRELQKSKTAFEERQSKLDEEIELLSRELGHLKRKRSLKVRSKLVPGPGDMVPALIVREGDINDRNRSSAVKVSWGGEQNEDEIRRLVPGKTRVRVARSGSIYINHGATTKVRDEVQRTSIQNSVQETSCDHSKELSLVKEMCNSCSSRQKTLSRDISQLHRQLVLHKNETEKQFIESQKIFSGLSARHSSVLKKYQRKDEELRLLQQQHEKAMKLLATCTKQRDLLSEDNRLLKIELDNLYHTWAAKDN